MDAPSTPPSPSPSRARAPLSLSPLNSCSASPDPSATCRPTPLESSTAPQYQSSKSKRRREVGIHIKSFFESTRPTLWTLAKFSTHCHSFASSSSGGTGDDYVWTKDKIYSLYIDNLNKLLTEGSLLATEAKIRRLLQRVQSRNAQSRGKGGKEKGKPSTPGAENAQDSRVDICEVGGIWYLEGYPRGAARYWLDVVRLRDGQDDSEYHMAVSTRGSLQFRLLTAILDILRKIADGRYSLVAFPKLQAAVVWGRGHGSCLLLPAPAPAPAPAPITIYQGVGAIISGSSGFSTGQAQTVLDGSKPGPDDHSAPSVVSGPPPQYQQHQPPLAPRPPPPATPPPREVDGEALIPGTPPAPPPVPPSGITLSDGTPIDIFFRSLRDSPILTQPPRYPYLLPSNILDLDDPSLALPESYLKELLKVTKSILPRVPANVTYALSRFPSPPDLSSYRNITETSPRPPGAPYSHLPTYINHAISHHLTLISKFCTSATELTPLLREGFFDSSINPWFIDNLFLAHEGNANMFLSRKEILSFIPGCGEKFDGVVRWADGIRAVDLGVVEVKKGNEGNVGAMGGRGDTGGSGDVGKVHRAMCGMLEILKGVVTGAGGNPGGEEGWEVLKRVQVLGIVNSGFNVTIMRMMYISPKVKVLRTHRTCRIGLHINRVREVFPLLRLLVQCQKAMENTLEVVLPFLRREREGEEEEDDL
ncbi:hypothetical protein EV426DRAFT_575564 [Tirmania nivea]|nr:hypothetical protein EV426DRAFT_575564 [Tirmania nivea]